MADSGKASWELKSQQSQTGDSEEPAKGLIDGDTAGEADVCAPAPCPEDRVPALSLCGDRGPSRDT